MEQRRQILLLAGMGFWRLLALLRRMAAITVKSLFRIGFAHFRQTIDPFMSNG